jgi:phenylalanyl-tRNA synthetase beta chain
MKFSLAWVFDHIDADWRSQDVSLILRKFNTITAEIEKVHKFTLDLSNFFIARVENVSNTGVTLVIPELKENITLPIISGVIINDNYIIKKENNNFYWAKVSDMGGEMGDLMPPVQASPQDLLGEWRTRFESEDVILEVDNKSLTHRPDMWGHRGFAREIAAFLNLTLLPEENFLAPCREIIFEKASRPIPTSEVTIENHSVGCIRFSGLHIKEINNLPSDIFIASRLIKTGARPIDIVVDLANYIAYDWSQPVHIYDIDKISGKKIIIRMGREGEKLTLLDKTEINLATQDIVIADEKKSLCLAGVKGGEHSGVTRNTRQLFFESGNFDSGTIRRTTQRHKLRSDASQRFEKTLSPYLTSEAIKRFIKILEHYKIKALLADEMITVGPTHDKDKIIEVTHEFLEKRLGVTIHDSQIKLPLEKLGFKVLKSHTPKEKIEYIISVPHFRASKDIKIKEDILEEIARYYGFENLPLILPEFVRIPFSLTPIIRARELKRYLSQCAKMIESQNYNLYDEKFIKELEYTPTDKTIEIINPVSENNYRLVTSLIPGLLKSIQDNYSTHETLYFFELGRTWSQQDNTHCENKRVTGIFLQKRNKIDFYKCTQYIRELFKELGFDSKKLNFYKQEGDCPIWYNSFQTASIKYENHTLGTIGVVSPIILHKIGCIPETNACIFDLDWNFLETFNTPELCYKEISKFQETYIDLSLMVPINLKAKDLEETLAQNVSDLVTQVELIDFFEKEEWTDVISLTFRLWLSHPEKTLEKSEIDSVWEKAVTCLKRFNVNLRT